MERNRKEVAGGKKKVDEAEKKLADEKKAFEAEKNSWRGLLHLVHGKQNPPPVSPNLKPSSVAGKASSMSARLRLSCRQRPRRMTFASVQSWHTARLKWSLCEDSLRRSLWERPPGMCRRNSSPGRLSKHFGSVSSCSVVFTLCGEAVPEAEVPRE
ncbi:hypothetical protein M427DRAFT_289094 [Gonapodya prolifera JEL478]|uniref:Uncharacterized protein n=1 Tax=Gonapodya prolifera (strain JEL478) TaxID=1344416 RepID=A0A139AIR4_GONPJ|nr:hypothetical protein M427DRAFT_289094 [Gonapodya prolifera JEL478]|eukprot:KXS16680.1 hypothetical protein M427DRAFT_289094 [Gonapodya prolifera JEL478]